MDELAQRILNIFTQMNSNTLDLHTLLEAGGNDPATREQVIEVVGQLSQQGFLEEQGSDFYKLTDKGREAL
jgi:predicted transcriptional regulator